MDKKLPIFDIVLNDEDIKQGVGMISLVDEPAIGVNWIKLRKHNVSLKFDKERQMLWGPFLIPNMLIYRSDEVNGEYYVRFSKDEIEKISTKFNEDLNSKNINLMHTNQKVDAFVSQNWIIESDQDKSKSFGFDLPEGTWFGGVKIKDTEFWKDKVKSEELKGFSVEILADLQLSLKNKKQKMKKMNFKKKFIAKQKFDEAVETEAGELIIVAEEIAVGESVVVVMDDLAVVETFDGTVEVGEMTVVIEGGEITEVMEGGEATETEDGFSLDGEGPCYEGYEMVGTKMVDGKEVPNCVPVVDGKPEKSTMNEESMAITAEEVSGMIDARFTELMEEISRLKGMIDKDTEEMNSFRKEVNEKFSSVPASSSIKKPEVKLDDKFAKTESRVREFAKFKK